MPTPKADTESSGATDAVLEDDGTDAGVSHVDPLDRLGKLVKTVAPPTFVVALLIYFGYAYQQRLFGEFGIDVDGLELSAAEYLIRSANVVVDPLAVVAALLAIAVAAHVGVMSLKNSRRGRSMWPVVAVASLSVVLGIGGIISPAVFTGVAHIVTSSAFALGTLFLIYGIYLIWVTTKNGPIARHMAAALSVEQRSHLKTILLASAVIIVAYGAFEVTKQVAIDRGEADARWIEEHCVNYPLVVLYSTIDLRLEHHPGVDHSIVSDEEGAFRHRYEGFRQLNHDNGKYLLWPDAASPRDGVLMLRDAQRLRLEPTTEPTAAGECPVESG